MAHAGSSGRFAQRLDRAVERRAGAGACRRRARRRTPGRARRGPERSSAAGEGEVRVGALVDHAPDRRPGRPTARTSRRRPPVIRAARPASSRAPRAQSARGHPPAARRRDLEQPDPAVAGRDDDPAVVGRRRSRPGRRRRGRPRRAPRARGSSAARRGTSWPPRVRARARATRLTTARRGAAQSITRVLRRRACGANVAARRPAARGSAPPVASVPSDSTSTSPPIAASRAPSEPASSSGRIGSSAGEDRARCRGPRPSASTVTPGVGRRPPERALHRARPAPARQQREVQVHRTERRERQHVGGAGARRRPRPRATSGAASASAVGSPRPSRTPSTSVQRQAARRAASATAVGREASTPRPAGLGGFVSTSATSTARIAAERLERRHRPRVVAEERDAQRRRSARAGYPVARRRLRGAALPGSASPSSIRRSSAQHRPAPVVVEPVDVEHAVQVVGLVLEDPREQALRRRSRAASPSRSCAAAADRWRRGVGWYGPGIDRQPSSSADSPSASEARGSR